MTAGVMVFASLLAVPASAFLCSTAFLAVFAVFPAASLALKNPRYFRNLFFVALAPGAVLLWAVLSNHPEAVSRSMRWICASSAGVFFAGVLEPSGISAILERIGAVRLSETMHYAGGAVSVAGANWKRNRNLPLAERAAETVRESVSADPPTGKSYRKPGAVPVIVAVFSWVFLLLSLAGVTG